MFFKPTTNVRYHIRQMFITLPTNVHNLDRQMSIPNMQIQRSGLSGITIIQYGSRIHTALHDFFMQTIHAE